MKRVLALLAAVVIPPAIYFPTLGADLAARRTRADSDLRAVETRLEQARAAQRKLQQFRDERAQLDAEVVKLRRILPPQLDMEQIRGAVDGMATANGVRLTRFETFGKITGSAPQVQSFAAEVNGSAEGTAAFFLRIANASTIFDVDDVTLRPAAGGWRTDFILTAFALPDRH